MKELLFLAIFLVSAGCGTLTSVVLRRRLGNKLEELDSDPELNPKEESGEGTPEEEHE